MAKKTKTDNRRVVTPKLLVQALDRVIGMADHPACNEGKEFSFVITNELHDIMKTRDAISFAGLFDDKKDLIRKMHAAQISDYVKPHSKTCPIHEILDIDENNDDGVWIVVTVRIFGLEAALEPDPVYYRKASEYS